MKQRFVAFAVLAGLLSLLLVAPTAAASPAGTLTSLPVTGTVTNALGQTGTFTGTVSNLSTTVNSAGQLVLNGTLNGTSTIGGVVTTITNALFSTIVTPSGTCQILTLNVGAIHLDLLGLVVNLSPINLDIHAVSGAGNLLGNLLCGVAHLLDNGGPVNGISGLLNNLFRQLGL